MSEMPRMNSEDILIRWQMTPNPMAIKFIVNHALKQEGKATFSTALECEHIPLARDLFAIPGVKQVYFFTNTATITHDGSLAEEELTEQVKAVLKSRLPIHDPQFLGPDEAVKSKPTVSRAEGDPEMLRQIEEILDRTIRPGLQADGGDIEVSSFANNELRIYYQGACGGCPSSMMGTLDAIQGILRQELGNSELLVIPS